VADAPSENLRPETLLQHLHSKVDFRDFDPKQLPLGKRALRIITRIRRLFEVAAWRSGLGNSLKEIDKSLTAHFESRRVAMKDASRRATALYAELHAGLRARLEAVVAESRHASALPTPPKEAGKFVLAMKAVDEDTGLGLPSALVRLLDGKRGHTPIAEAFTDSDGNALFSLDEAVVAKLDSDVDPIVEVTDGEKDVFRANAAMRPRPGTVDTFVANVKSATRTKPLVEAAKQIAARREASMELLKEAIARMDVEHKERLTELQKLEEAATAAIDEIGKRPPAPKARPEEAAAAANEIPAKRGDKGSRRRGSK
jgi:hypothetical protein